MEAKLNQKATNCQNKTIKRSQRPKNKHGYNKSYTKCKDIDKR